MKSTKLYGYFVADFIKLKNAVAQVPQLTTNASLNSFCKMQVVL
jgi:hypothetical protein